MANTAQKIEIQNLEKEIKELSDHLKMERMPISQSAAETFRFVEEKENDDFLFKTFQATTTRRNTPWDEKTKCKLL